ncbi:MAG: hypothetical protein ACK4RN_03225 [Pseudorhodobacter sp.]
MRSDVVCAIIAGMPAISFADMSGAEVSQNYEIIGTTEASEVLVKDRTSYFACELKKRDGWKELTACQPIMSASQHQKREASIAKAQLVARFEEVSEAKDRTSMLELISSYGCQMPNLVPLNEVIGADQIWDREPFVNGFGEILGFSDKEQASLGKRIPHLFDWTVRTMLDEGVLTAENGKLVLKGGCN